MKCGCDRKYVWYAVLIDTIFECDYANHIGFRTLNYRYIAENGPSGLLYLGEL